MSCVPMETSAFELGPRDYLDHLITLISSLRGGESRYLPLVMAKLGETLPQMMPSVPQPLNLKAAIDQKEQYHESSSSPESIVLASSPFCSPNHTTLPVRLHVIAFGDRSSG